jgi:hypothetical protein
VKLFNKVLLGTIIAGTFSLSAQAAPLSTTVWEVYNAVDKDPTLGACQPAHGLWVGKGDCTQNPEHHFGFDTSKSTFTEINLDGTKQGRTAELDATLYNNAHGFAARIDMQFFDYDDNARGKMVKDQGGLEAANVNTWEFYHNFSGVIEFDLNQDGLFDTTFNVYYDSAMVTGAATNGKPAMQVGVGANDKNGAYGASTWIDAYVTNSTLDNYGAYLWNYGLRDEFWKGHWDINMELKNGITTITPPPPPSVKVSEPGTLAILGLGLLGFAARRRQA